MFYSVDIKLRCVLRIKKFLFAFQWHDWNAWLKNKIKIGFVSFESKTKYFIMEGPERVVCCTLCMCMAVAVFSSVALVYLTALVYVPAKREIQSGLSHVPAMCTTILREETDDCDWSSCREWCLSKESHCIKLWAQVRKNGTDVVLEHCTNIQDITCKVINSMCIKTILSYRQLYFLDKKHHNLSILNGWEYLLA